MTTAVASRVPLVVDDVTADLDFAGPSARSLTASHAPEAAEMITIGSLSKLLWGGLRVGWIRAQPPLIGRLARLKAVHDLGSAVIDQLAATALLSTVDDIAAQRSRLLQQRHDHLCAALRSRLPDWTFQPAAGGQTLWVRLPHGDATSYAQIALRNGVAVLPGASLDPCGQSARYLRLPFVAEPAVITTAVDALAEAWYGYSPSTDGPPPLPALAM